MNDPLFDAKLLSRILLVQAGLALPAVAAGCGDGAGSDAGGAGGASTSSTSSASSSHASTTSTSGSTASSTSAGTTSGATTTAASTGTGATDTERCFPLPAAGCPALADAATAFGPCTNASEKVLAWLSGPTTTATECCYQVDVSAPGDPACGVAGRPFVVAERARVAPVGHRSAPWSRFRVDEVRVHDLDARARAGLAREWARDAAYEHASVASFGKLALELIAFGAPADLLRRCHQAALDEVRHAEIAFAVASRYAGASLGPDSLVEARRVEGATSLAELAVAALHEGCFGETVAAVVASRQAGCCDDPALASLYATIADDEASHAELAFAIVAWAVASGGETVKSHLRRAVAAAVQRERALEVSVSEEHRSVARGRLSAEQRASIRRRAIDEIVAPALSSLLGAA